MDGRGVVRVVDVEHPLVGVARHDLRLDLLDESREHDRQQVRVGEHAVGGLVDAVGKAVGADAILDGAGEDVVVGQDPLEERLRGSRVVAAGLARPQAQRQVAHLLLHVAEVLDRGEHRLQHRIDLVLHVMEPLLRVDAFDLEVGVDLLRALVVDVADADDLFPLAADGEDRVRRGEHADAGFAEVVLEALVDERHVRRVGLHHRDLVRNSVRRPLAHPLALVGVAHHHVQSGQALVELVRRRHLAHHETELVGDARGHGVGAQAEDDAVGGGGVHHRGEGQQQLAVGGRRGLQHGFDFNQPGGAFLGILGDHAWRILILRQRPSRGRSCYNFAA